MWDRVCCFEVYGIPKAQPRTRRAKNGGVYNPDTADAWKLCLALTARAHLPEAPITGPVRVSELFTFPRPARLSGKASPDDFIPHTAKPDRDNLDKAVLDTLTNEGFFRDDAQVCGGSIEKFYHRKDGRPGVVITIEVYKEGRSA